jgi:nitrite reductase/ring-hydroxylating ferredoxin subunit
MPRVELGTPEQLGRQVVNCFEHAGHKFVLVFHDQQFYLLDDLCPHKAASLCEGQVKDGAIECPWHKARFDLTTGDGFSALAGGRGVSVYPVMQENGRLWADLDIEPE